MRAVIAVATSLLVLFLALLANHVVVQAFTTTTPLQRQRRQRSTRLWPTASTTTDEERMTDQDEAILFGDGDHGNNEQHERKIDKFGNVLSDSSNKQNPLDHVQGDPLINKLHTMRETITSCPQLWLELAKICPDLRAVYDDHLCDNKIEYTFAEFATMVKKSAGLFQNLGVRKGTHVAVLGENSAQWLLIDQGLQLAGGASAVRGADAPLDELRYIYEHSDSANIAVLQGPKLLKKLAASSSGNNKLGLSNPKYGDCQTVILMHREKASGEELDELSKQLNINIQVFGDLLEASDPITDMPVLNKNDLSTIVYTSGTTGRPKGVMLSHGNLLHQKSHRLAPSQHYETSEPLPGECMVSLLPVWHITERTFELWMASRGCSVVYSSIRTFKKDLERHKPQWMVLVPRVLEKIAAGVQEKFSSGSAAVKVLSKFFTNVGKAHAKHQKIVKGLVVSDENGQSPVSGFDEIISRLSLLYLKPLHKIGTKLVWSKVQDGFGGNLKVIISGGSALAGSLEEFYETAGLTICVGYGLTECSPLIAYRRSDANLVTAGCVGWPCIDTELRVVDPSVKVGDVPRPALPDGEAGVILAKGPQVTRGYYKNPEATAKAIDQFGWFDTGDLGRINAATGDLILTGRAKDTIVLSNGENIEPVPIEDALMGASSLVDQVMLTGQDGRSLVAISVLNPMELAKEGYIDPKEGKVLQDAADVMNDPKCTEEECEIHSRLLQEASKKIRSSKELENAIGQIFKTATAADGFRKWEKVSEFYLTLEPFAMVNGQLTQSYKVKRAQVMERYGDELPK